MTLKSYFRSRGYLSDPVITTESGDCCDLSQLPAFLRTLLVADGTVTKALEAWFWESVKVVPLVNKQTKLNALKNGLKAEKGENVLQREVILQGVSSDQIFACARSIVALEQLPDEIGRALKSGKIGIGELFREKGLETYRDIFAINHYKSDPKNDAMLDLLKGNIVSRSYRIWLNGNPAIIVTEYFPVDIY